MNELQKKIEAILFSVGKFITIEEISQLVKTPEKETHDALLEMQTELENEKSSLVLLHDADQWKLTIREEYGGLVRSILTETELSKTVLETLAVIAFKYPIKQSDLIAIRTNKAYDHLTELEKLGFITRQRFGRSRLIKLTDKFFEYFDLPQEKLKDRFKGFEQLATTIKKKEEDVNEAKQKQREMAEEARKQAELERKVNDGEIDLIDDEGEAHELEKYGSEKSDAQVETYEGTSETNNEVADNEEVPSEEDNDVENSKQEDKMQQEEVSEEIDDQDSNVEDSKQEESTGQDSEDNDEEIENQESAENEPLETESSNDSETESESTESQDNAEEPSEEDTEEKQ